MIRFSDYRPDADAMANGERLTALFSDAMASGRTAIIDGGAQRDWPVRPSAFLQRTLALTADLSLASDGAGLAFEGEDLDSILRLEPPGQEARLVLPLEPAAISLDLDRRTGVAPGWLAHLVTATRMSRGQYAAYPKSAVAVVDGVEGNRLRLRSALPFHFTVEETTVVLRPPRRVSAEGLRVAIGGGRGRLTIAGTSGSRLTGLRVQGTGAMMGDPFFVSGTVDTRLSDVFVQGTRYGISIGHGALDTLIEDVDARDNHHPIDPNTWAYRTLVRRFRGTANRAMIQSHPSLATRFEEGESSELGAAYFNRSLGGGLRNVRILQSQGETRIHRSPPPTTFIGLDDAHAYLNEEATHLLENVDAPQGYIQIGEGRRVVMCNVAAASFRNNGNAFGAQEVHIDRFCRLDNVVILNTPLVVDDRPIAASPPSERRQDGEGKE